MGDGPPRALLLRRGDRQAGAALRGAWTRSPASARRCRSPARCWSSTTARATARPSGPRAPGGRRDDRAATAAPGKGANDSQLLARARRAATRCCSTRTPSCARAPRIALWQSAAGAPPGGARRSPAARPRRRPQPCAWRFPSPATALACALGLQRLLVVQSRGREVREVDWCQSSALLVRREAAAQVGYLDPDFFVYSDEVDFARRLATPAGTACTSPAPRRCTTSSSPTTPSAAGRGSSNSPATATSTCASTTPPPRPVRCAG